MLGMVFVTIGCSNTTQPVLPQMFTVKYSLGEGVDGTAPVDNNQYMAGQLVTLAAAPSREGFVFMVWNDGSTDYPAGSFYTMGSKNVLFTAKWQSTSPSNLDGSQNPGGGNSGNQGGGNQLDGGGQPDGQPGGQPGGSSDPSNVTKLNKPQVCFEADSLLEDGMGTKVGFKTSIKVKISTGNAYSIAKLCYTTDGTDPTASSTEYTSPITVTETTTIKVRAIATSANYSDSDVVTEKVVKMVAPAGFVSIEGDVVKSSVGSGAFSGVTSGNYKYVKSFYMGETEVTYAKWKEVYDWATDDSARGANVYTFANAGREGSGGTDGDANTTGSTQPVTKISIRDAMVWCNAASEMDGLTPYYTDDQGGIIRKSETQTEAVAGNAAVEKIYGLGSGNGYHLPNEAQWEYAARGGNPNAAEWRWGYAGTSTGSSLADYAVYNESGTANVKTKLPNTAGLYDMNGNVDEWVATAYGSASSKDSWYVKGGYYGKTSAADVSNSPRVYWWGYDAVTSVGFRIIRNVE